MSEVSASGSTVSLEELEFAHEATAVPLSAGQLIRQAREEAGLHIAALAVSLKVPVKKLEALESDRFDLLPDAVFVRALASSVCRTLKIDASPVLVLLPQTSRPKLIYQGAGINAPFRAPGDAPGPSWWSQISRPAVLTGLALVLSALVLVLMPAVKNAADDAKSPDSAALGPNTAEVKEAGSVVPAEGLGSVTATAASGVLPVQEFAGNMVTPTIAATPLPASSQSAPPFVQSAVPPVPKASATVLPPSQLAASPVATTATVVVPAGVVIFSAKGDSWVEVTDAKGTVVLRRTLSAGEVAGASGVLPLAAVVGRADATQVQVRGKSLDLSAYSRDNVARFEVK